LGHRSVHQSWYRSHEEKIFTVEIKNVFPSRISSHRETQRVLRWSRRRVIRLDDV